MKPYSGKPIINNANVSDGILYHNGVRVGKVSKVLPDSTYEIEFDNGESAYLSITVDDEKDYTEKIIKQ